MVFSWKGVASALALGVAGGAIGAVSMIVAKVGISQAVLIATIPWLLTTLGWIASARLSESAQRRMFRHNIVNTARGEIVRAIRAQGAWAGSLGVFGLTALSGWERFIAGRPVAIDIRAFAQNTLDELRRKLFVEEGSIADLVMILEEYELLFPQTRHVRDQLSHYAGSQLTD